MAALFVYLQNTVARLRERQEGQTMAEYALILGGIAIVVILAIVFLGGRIDDLFRGDRQLRHEPGLLAPSVHAGRPRSPIAAGRRSSRSGRCRGGPASDVVLPLDRQRRFEPEV